MTHFPLGQGPFPAPLRFKMTLPGAPPLPRVQHWVPHPWLFSSQGWETTIPNSGIGGWLGSQGSKFNKDNWVAQVWIFRPGLAQCLRNHGSLPKYAPAWINSIHSINPHSRVLQIIPGKKRKLYIDPTPPTRRQNMIKIRNIARNQTPNQKIDRKKAPFENRTLF